MATYKFIARNSSTGEKITSIIQADSEKSATKMLTSQGLSPIEIKLASGEGKLGKKVKSKDRILFARQLSTLINAGLPLVQSLRTVQRQTTSKQMKLIIAEVIADVEAGKNFSDALAKHPMVFNNIFVSLVAAGEISGTLDKSLERLAYQQEKDAEILAKIKGALVYPAVVIVIMVAVVVFMLVAVLPQVQVLYDGLPGAELPFITKLLLWMSNLIIDFWYVFVILAILGIVFTSRWARTLGGKSVIDKAKMKAPMFGPLFMKMYMARFARTGTTLVSAGVPLIQMLEITGKSVNNMYVEQSVTRAIGMVKGGKSLADALEGDENFLELVPNMIRIGETSGQVEGMLDKTAEYYEKEVDQQIKTINTIIEPLLMIILGVIALTIIGAVLLPVYSLGDKGLGGF
jgi:type IV pilus assembly protein PilC